MTIPQPRMIPFWSTFWKNYPLQNGHEDSQNYHQKDQTNNKKNEGGVDMELEFVFE